MELYRGYIRTKNKKAVEKFKDVSTFKSYEDVKEYPEYAGVLASDTILIDIDEPEMAEMLMDIVEDLQLNCRVYQTTRGKHFLFKNSSIDKCYTHTNLAIGLIADIKVGSKNSYEVIKYDGVERFVEWDSDTIDELPKWLYPIKYKGSFVDMTNGDGRNSTLFSYILTLQKSKFTKDEIKNCISLINKYILKEPLSSDELSVVLRDDAFTAEPSFFEDNKFLFSDFAKYLINAHHIIRINNQLHIYKDGIYISGLDEIESTMIQHIADLSQAKRREVLSYIDITVRDNTELSSPTLIAFNNGIYNLATNDLMSFNPSYVITNKIPYDYNPTAYHELLDTTLNKISCNDEQIRANLEEMAGYCLFRRNELGKCFILTGEGSNGKSTYLNLIKNMLGRKNYSVLDLKKLGDRFSTVMLFGKLANIGDDISSEFLSDVAEFRKIVTGEEIDAEQKGQPKFNFIPYVKCIFSSNSVPRMGKGKDFNAIKRRLVIIPFNAHFSKNDKDFKPYIADALKGRECMEYLIILAIEGLKRVLANKSFTDSDKANAELEAYEELANPIIGFVKDNMDEIANNTVVNVYNRYVMYCSNNNLQSLGQKAFSRQICKMLNLTSVQRRVNGKRLQVLEEVV